MAAGQMGQKSLKSGRFSGQAPDRSV